MSTTILTVMDPAVRRSLFVGVVVVAAAVAFSGGYGGVSWYLERAVSRQTPLPAVIDLAKDVPTPSGRGRLIVNATGDVNLDPRQLGLARSSFAAPWDGLRGLFTTDDLTIVNLECSPGAGGAAQDKQYTFRCEGGHDQMRAAGVEVANLGNNHAGDYGPEALVDGIDRLRRARVASVGAGRDARQANAPALFELKGWKVAVLGFGGVVPEPGWIAGANHPGVADGYSTASMVEAVRAADMLADLVFVTIHWGEERDPTPRPDDLARAHALVDAGADAVFGHHAHRLQPLEFYKGRPIAYGLGNFVWPTGGATAVAQVIVSAEGGVEACLLPATIRGGRPSLDGPSSCPAS